LICIPHDQFCDGFSYSQFLGVNNWKIVQDLYKNYIEKRTMAKNVTKLIMWYMNKKWCTFELNFGFMNFEQ